MQLAHANASCEHAKNPFAWAALPAASLLLSLLLGAPHSGIIYSLVMSLACSKIGWWNGCMQLFQGDHQLRVDVDAAFQLLAMRCASFLETIQSM